MYERQGNIESQLEDNGIQIVQLGPESWQLLREIKLRSLTLEPIAFEDQTSGLKRYRARTEEEWREKLDEKKSNTISVFAQDGFQYVGMVNGVMQLSERIAEVQHMYVDSVYRGQKIGGRLLGTLLQKLKEKGIKTVELFVVEDQMPARNLYENHDFKVIDRKPAERGNGFVMEIKMSREL